MFASALGRENATKKSAQNQQTMLRQIPVLSPPFEQATDNFVFISNFTLIGSLIIHFRRPDYKIQGWPNACYGVFPPYKNERAMLLVPVGASKVITFPPAASLGL